MKRLAQMTLVLVTLQGLVGLSPAHAASGDQLWVTRYNDPVDGGDVANAMAVSPDGTRVFVTGFTQVAAKMDYATAAYDASTGTQLWSRRYNGPGNDQDYADAVAVSLDGASVFVTGYSVGAGTDRDYATIAYSAVTGATLWSRRYNNANGSDTALAVAVSPDGTQVFVTGQGGGAVDATIAYNATTGATLWDTQYQDPNGGGAALALAVTADGARVFVTGDSGGDYTTIAYGTADGTLAWVSHYNGTGNSYDYGRSVAVSPDGNRVFVTGYSKGSLPQYDYATIAYDAASGATLWVSRYDGTTGGQDYAWSLGVSPDGSRVFVTGQSKGSGTGNDYATVAYDAASGDPLWVSLYRNMPGIQWDAASALAVSPDGTQVFVTGASKGFGTSLDYATVAYAPASGEQLWVSRFDGPVSARDEARAIAVAPDGTRVFVTGQSAGSGTGLDFATAAYEA